MKECIGYVRVSTQKQGQSGLGLESQKASIEAWANAHALKPVFVTEIESGKIKSRPGLAKAIEMARQSKAVLVVAKLDRLARDVRFLFELRDSGLQFVALDIPELNTLSLGLFATFAQYERERISERTKAALAEVAKRKILGNPSRVRGTKQATAEKMRRADERRRRDEIYKPFIEECIEQGLSVRETSLELAKRGMLDADGVPVGRTRIYRILKGE
jgi:DNA invertase Pin-like site-specific DNA recombinase